MNSRDNTHAHTSALEPRLSRRATLVGGAATVGGLGAAGVLGAASAADAATAEKQMRGLSLRQQAGQRVIYSYPGLTPPPELYAAIRAGEVGGVIFFGENITSTAQVADVTASLRAAHQDSPTRAFPLLLNTDQEGGVVRRLKEEEPVLRARQVGDSPDYATVARTTGIGAASGLKKAGMNLNLAPVLDVYREEGNFDDQFGRSYSKDPRVVAICGREFLTAQQRDGVAATTKHFPGLGAAPAGANTDLERVVLDVSRSDLRGIDELPFRAAIRAGVDIVMTSWAVYPALDPQLPAGLSPTIVRDELRRRLRFRGVTITDALEAGSLAEYGDVPARSVKAASAGMDLLLASSRTLADGTGSVTALAEARRVGRLGSLEWYAALVRIALLRYRLR